ncbi:hypothetical protein DXT94_08815 [Rhizobium sp. ICMP 5592]|nr:hypothetical protein [Rhizobium sp. ICMP 5592]
MPPLVSPFRTPLRGLKARIDRNSPPAIQYAVAQFEISKTNIVGEGARIETRSDDCDFMV